MRLRTFVERGATVPDIVFYSDGLVVGVLTDEDYANLFNDDQGVEQTVAPNLCALNESAVGLSETLRHFGRGLIRWVPNKELFVKVIVKPATTFQIGNSSIWCHEFCFDEHPLFLSFLRQRVAEGSFNSLLDVWQYSYAPRAVTPYIVQDAFKSPYDGITHSVGI